MSDSGDILKAKQTVQDMNRIEVILGSVPNGITRMELLKQLGWDNCPAEKQRLKRLLDQLRRDPTSDVVALKNGEEYGYYDEEMPNSRHEILWKLKKAANNKAELDAITLVTAKKYASIFLPPEQRKWLEDRYDEMSRKDSRYRFYDKWHDKIKIESRYPAIYPKYSKQFSEIENIIFSALQLNTSFTAQYNFSSEANVFYPVRLIRRERILYVLCAHTENNPSFKEFAIHRLFNVKAEKYSLDDKYLSSSYIDNNLQINVPGPWGKIDEVKIRITGPARFHFTEVNFHEEQINQSLTHVDLEYENQEDDLSDIKSIIVTIKDLAYTYEFRTWLLGFGANIEILSPENIRSDIKNEISKMLNMY